MAGRGWRVLRPLLLWLPATWASAACDFTAADAAGAGVGCAQAWMDRHLRLDDIQLLATHNSYKRALPGHELAAHRARDPRGADGIDYAHRPLAEQLARGVRGFELDVYHDPRGGRFAHADAPAGLARSMRQPGFKVMHLADIDWRSRCQPFRECLRQLRAWSRAHPRHVPIIVQINAKDGPSAPGQVQPLPFDTAAFDALDAEIRDVFSEAELILPDQVLGAGDPPRWPTLGQARGRFLFALDEDEAKVSRYRGARRQLEGRVMFVNTGVDSAAAGWRTLNDPRDQAEAIRQALAAGLLVRTRADADTREARAGDARRRDAAFASGAQIVSTDYIDADARFGEYRVALPGGGIARCRPRPGDDPCAGLAIGETP
ncbi:Ca2+-dependent phosphoinositide-specific phospholipase C [Pseudoxanthomonas sp. 22568]|uniref:Ca2+-dependent phosphoinositide-specific phospholipase C n=1 Tax=Pseudoxanthomonas sp. 22568 TaxID=3453945 RepID=UPI003F870FAB